MADSEHARAWFADAARGFVELVQGTDPAELGSPGLGEWSVRDLIGHTARALSTIESYLAADVPEDAVRIPDATTYFRVALGGAVDHSQIAQRGREAGRALGDDPAQTVTELAQRVVALVDGSGDDAPVATAVGPMALIDYLPTRAFELTVHSLDLAHALSVDLPVRVRSRAADALGLLTRLATDEHAVVLLRSLTGRAGLPAGFSVLDP